MNKKIVSLIVGGFVCVGFTLPSLAQTVPTAPETNMVAAQEKPADDGAAAKPKHHHKKVAKGAVKPNHHHKGKRAHKKPDADQTNTTDTQMNKAS
jgi:hypothetical protein